MNDDARISRVRIRERVMPLLRAENPALDDALLRLAGSARGWLEVIDGVAEPLARFPIDCAALGKQPEAIRKRAVALALERAGLTYDASHLEAVDSLVLAPSRGEVVADVPGAQLVRSYDALSIVEPHETPVDLVAPAGYELRIWRPGDRMRPARLKGRSRKLSDLYGDAKIPRRLRDAARVLVGPDATIVWAEHVGVAFGEALDLVPKPARSGGSF
jgi:tRNA(Ile)-lysidine synthase